MRKILFILLLLAAIWWMWHCVYGHNEHIEADVSQRATNTLGELIAGSEVALQVDGRDVILTGIVSSKVEKALLLKTARDTYGVARVFDELTVLDAPVEPQRVDVITPAPAPVALKTCFDEIPAWMNAQKISFDSARSSIKADSYSVLDEMALKLKDCAGVMISVEGHTDSDGGAEANQTLSAKRAAAVATHLKNIGVNQDMSSAGYGESQPVASNDTREGKAKNRRVVFTITEKN